MKKIRRWLRLILLFFLGSIILSFLGTLPSQAHVADLAIINIVVESKISRINLTFPTQLVAFADDNRDRQLSLPEIRRHRSELQDFFKNRLRLTNSQGQRGTVAVGVTGSPLFGLNGLDSNTHSTVSLTYTWPEPVNQLQIDYDLFSKSANTHCLATILNNGEIQNYTLTPNHPILQLKLSQKPLQLLVGGGLIALAVAFSWGAIHALSPGHGKTLVGAYLVGSRAKAKHALFLGLTTTVTHTLGVFVLGAATFAASRYLLPIQFYPWLSLASGMIISIVGINLLLNRLSSQSSQNSHPHFHEQHHHHHHPSHAHEHEHEHEHEQQGHHHFLKDETF